MKHPVKTRRPTTEERAAAVRLSQRLLMATVPDYDTDEVSRNRPPGKVSVREAKNLLFQQENMMPETATPWTLEEETMTDSIPTKCAIMCDCSGSMGGAQEALGVTRWILTEAMHRIQGEVAAVLFGYEAYGIQPPHKRVTEVEVYHAGDGYENYVEGFSMLDGALDLIDGDGARLLCIITDGHFNLSEAVKYAEETMDMCRQAGVGVLWVNVSGYFAREDTYGYGTLIDAKGLTPVQIANALGDAVVAEFRKAQKAAGASALARR